MNGFTQNERLIDAMSTHWIKYVPQAILCHFLALVGLGILYSSYLLVNFSPLLSIASALIGGILFLIAHHKWFHKVLSEEFIDIILTSERIIYFDDFLFLADNEHEIPLQRIASVDVQQEGIVQNALDYGTIWVDTGGGVIDLRRCIPNVPHPDKLSQKIAELARLEQ